MLGLIAVAGFPSHDEKVQAPIEMESRPLSRRNFFRRIRWAPALFLPAPLQYRCFPRSLEASPFAVFDPSVFFETRLTPHFPAQSPLDGILKLVPAGSDAFISEKYAADLSAVLDSWSKALLAVPLSSNPISNILSATIAFNTVEGSSISLSAIPAVSGLRKGLIVATNAAAKRNCRNHREIFPAVPAINYSGNADCRNQEPSAVFNKH